MLQHLATVTLWANSCLDLIGRGSETAANAHVRDVRMMAVTYNDIIFSIAYCHIIVTLILNGCIYHFAKYQIR